MTFLSGLVLFIAAVLGGALNSVAGGGSFITFPSLIFSGVPPIQANATSTVALWPGSLASVGAYRKEIAKQNRVLMLVLVGTSLIGGILGAVLGNLALARDFAHELQSGLKLAVVLQRRVRIAEGRRRAPALFPPQPAR